MYIKTYFLYTISLFVLFFVSESSASKNISTNLYIISDKSFVGDRSQLLGVAGETTEYFKSKSLTVNTEEYDISQLKSLEEKIKNNNDLNVLVSVGYYGIKSIMDLKKDKDIANKIIAVHLSHQLLDNGELSHLQLIQAKGNDTFGADIVVLPEHTLDQDLRKKLTGANTVLLSTRGVPHNLQLSGIETDYNQYKSQIPVNDKYLVVILAGDVPVGKDKYNCYITEEAEKLAMHVSDMALKNNYFVLIANGPRTGKYDCQAQNKRDVHSQNSTLDPITLGFQQVLTKRNVSFKLFDFKLNQPSMYKALLGVVLYNDHSLILVPGESTSMVSEITDTINGNKVIVYYTPTMNPEHIKHVQQEFGYGHVSVLDKNMHTQSKRNVAQVPITPANEVIAKTIYNVWQEHSTKMQKTSYK